MFSSQGNIFCASTEFSGAARAIHGVIVPQTVRILDTLGGNELIAFS